MDTPLDDVINHVLEQDKIVYDLIVPLYAYPYNELTLEEAEKLRTAIMILHIRLAELKDVNERRRFRLPRIPFRRK